MILMIAAKESLFVMDYDYNAPSVEYLSMTHRRMFEKIRAAQPALPIILLSRPKYILTEEDDKRRDIIYDTYKKAKESGDSNVYFIDGRKLMEWAGDNGTVDGTHPTDSGFLSMACAIGAVLEVIFKATDAYIL